MVGRLVLRNLFHRPVRTGLTILAVAVEVMMIVMMVGTSEGLLRESLRRTRGVGADVLIRPEISGATISGADISAKLPGILMERYGEITHALGATVHTPGNLQTITGVDWPAFDAMSGGIVLFDGRPYESGYEAVVDEVYARQQDVGVGGRIELMGHEFEVVGVAETGKMSRVFIPPETMGDLQGWQDRYSQVYLKLDDPSKARPLIAELRAMMPNRSVISVEDFLALTATSVRQMSSQFVNVIISIAVVIGFIVVMLAMYTAILERTREIGILKAIGSSKRFIGAIILREDHDHQRAWHRARILPERARAAARRAQVPPGPGHPAPGLVGRRGGPHDPGIGGRRLVPGMEGRQSRPVRDPVLRIGRLEDCPCPTARSSKSRT